MWHSFLWLVGWGIMIIGGLILVPAFVMVLIAPFLPAPRAHTTPTPVDPAWPKYEAPQPTSLEEWHDMKKRGVL
jgi:hypothetical protein